MLYVDSIGGLHLITFFFWIIDIPSLFSLFLRLSLFLCYIVVYSGFTVTILAQNNALHSIVAIIYCTLCFLALSSHAKTTFTNPGTIPFSSSSSSDDDATTTIMTIIPTEENTQHKFEFPMCSVCETYKPTYTHHCRICNRCISGMDHHCPWMNNCIGKGNLKFFILFLVYLWLASAYALVLFGLNYFMCRHYGSDGGGGDDDGGGGNGVEDDTTSCTFPDVVIHLVRIMTLLCIGAFWFTSNMIMSIMCLISTGLGTIDRMKMEEEEQEEDYGDGVAVRSSRRSNGNFALNKNAKPIPLKDIFGIEHYYTWFLPVDPVFEDYDRVMGYSVVPRLLREKKMDSTYSS